MATGIPQKRKNKADNDVTLSYVGKISNEEILMGQVAVLQRLWSSSKDQEWSNKLIFGDNLPVLRELANDDDVCGKIQLIYIDPPFSTQSNFQTIDQEDAYADVLSGAAYVEFIRERLVLLHKLLADNGSIYVHLDEKMVFEIKIIMDEIFGKNNFRNLITRKKCSTKNTTRKRYGDISDYILYYTKSKKYIWNRPYTEWPEEKLNKEYPCIDEKTGRRYKKVPVHAPGTRNGETGMEWRGRLPPAGKHWQVPPAKLDELDEKGEIYWSSTGNPRRKVWADESIGIPRQDIWLDFRDSINQNMKGTGYPTEKNLAMIQEIVKASSNPGDLVLDAFCGSGTTLHAAESLNRRWIGIDNSCEAISCTVKRFTTGIEAMGDYVNTNKATMSRVHTALNEVIPTASFTLEGTSQTAEVAKNYFGI